MIDNIEAQCEHILIEHGIHEFRLRDFGARGADAYFAQLEALYQDRSGSDEPLRLLLDTMGGSMPISYSLQRGKDLYNKYPNSGKIYSAALTHNPMEARVVDSFLRVTRFARVQVRFFDRRARNEAIEWLLSV